MTRRSLFLCAAIVGLAVTLAAGPAAAASGRLGLQPADEVRSLFAPLWDFLSSLFSGEDSTLPGETPDTRCGIDPDGRTYCGETGASGASPDNRCTIDPDGRTFCGDTPPSDG